mmetsp:Transcript_18979/g.54394  ORF Transcript_18979/g.54394 Transcript_18979/m.54394 type:complete len:104 (+) Transcript_18979:169-480(+)
MEGFMRSHPVVLLDGGLATELERQGYDLNHPLWSTRLLTEARRTFTARMDGLIDEAQTCSLCKIWRPSVTPICASSTQGRPTSLSHRLTRQCEHLMTYVTEID